MLCGAILVGGQSRRMGRPKALLQIRGIPLVEQIAHVLSPFCFQVVAVGPQQLAASIAAVPDLYPGAGPLGGLLSALEARAEGCDRMVVVACDLINIQAPVINALLAADLDHIDAVMAHTDRLQPLCGLWNPRCLPVLQNAFDAGERSMNGVIKSLAIVSVPIEADLLANVNTPDDLYQARK